MSNASFSTRENFLEMDWENTQRTFEVTQFGAMHVCQHAARQMVAQGDPPEGTYKLVLISSVMAELSHLIRSSCGYNMAKASLDTLAKSLASGMAQHSITGAPARPPDRPPQLRLLLLAAPYADSAAADALTAARRLPD